MMRKFTRSFPEELRDEKFDDHRCGLQLDFHSFLLAPALGIGGDVSQADERLHQPLDAVTKFDKLRTAAASIRITRGR